MNILSLLRTMWTDSGRPRRAVRSCLILLLALLLHASVLLKSAAAQAPSGEAPGVESGNYHYQGSLEFGYRFVDTSGSGQVYDTFVDDRQGPRLFEQTLSIRSLNHQGTLFDNLFVSSFGWGGEAENASRLRMSKNKWYNFNMSFRRDRNVWDYNLLANPLNPPNPFIQVNRSPHRFETTRRMYDYNLTLLPQSPIRVRLGYVRNNMEGPSYSSFHEGTDVELFQGWRTLLDAYQIGVDIKLLPKTNISYDQFLQYYRGDNTWLDANLFSFQTSNGGPVDPGIIYNAAARQPCADTPTPIFDTSTTPQSIKDASNGYQFYTGFARVRTSYPTEQLTVQSSYFRHLDLSARGSYSSSEADVDNYSEALIGLVTRSNQRTFGTTGQTRAKRVVAATDLGVTFHVSEKFRIVDNFRFSYFRIPGSANLLTSSLFGATLVTTPNVFDPAACPPPFTAATCPQHNSSSPADISGDHASNFVGQDSKLNTFELEYDLVPRFTGYVGYRFERRTITHNTFDLANLTFYPTLPNRGACAGQPLDANGVCTVTTTESSSETPLEVNGHSLLLGFNTRPIDQLRLSFDLELFSADASPTRISPRNQQRVKARAHYRPKDWINASGTINVLESRNNVIDVLHREHNRNVGFTVMLSPKPRFGFEFGYNYDDIFSTTNVCYVITSTPPPNSTLCSVGTPFLAGVSTYNNRIHFGYTSIMFKPVKRVTANLGYNLTSTSGDTLILSPTPNALGPLGLNFHRPTASVDVDLAKGFTWRTGWNYYDYNEKSDPGPVPFRDFHSNSATLSLRYAF